MSDSSIWHANPGRAACSQDNFAFFERAVAFLRTVSDDELAACVATYARFLRTAANSDGSVPCFAAELCWRVHLLSPFIYAKYCEKNFGKLIDHVALPVGEYPIEAPDAEPAGDAPSAKPLAAFLVPAIRRQQDFMEKMLARRGVMESPAYMAAAVESYLKFLGLMKKHEGVTLVPTLAIDLVWHTHQYYPVRYAAECEAVAGRAINHDDSIEDDELAEDDGSAAVRVLRRFAFAGVQSAWNDTVRAFASQFGSPPAASDFVVSRPGWRPPGQPERVAWTAALLRAERRAYRADEAVVRAAEAMLRASRHTIMRSRSQVRGSG